MTATYCKHGFTWAGCGTCYPQFTDPVHAPSHYTFGGIETIDYLEAKLSPEEFAGFCKGNALKYISRAGHKGDAAEDMRKAIWYLERLLRQGAAQKAQPKAVE